MCCAYCCVGDPLSDAVPGARMTTYCRPACERCGIRLTKVKHHRAYESGRACHPRCRTIKAVATPQPTPAAPSIELLSQQPIIEMKIIPSPSSISKHLHTQTALPPLLFHDSPTFLSHCWSLRRFCRRGLFLSLKWMDLIKSGELIAWEEKRCKFWQLDSQIHLQCSHMDGLRIFLRSSTETFFRSVLRDHGIDVDCLRMVDIKLLRTAYKEGLQEIHCDIPDPEMGARCFTCLLYLTATTSTAVPLIPHSSDRHAACYIADASTVRTKLLQRNHFDSCKVFPGDSMIVRGDCPHFGVANPDEALRYVLFCCFSPKKQPLPNTEDQRYPQGVHN
jgi:hypothetical protein